jgi:C-terminal peptidase (prc)
MKKIFLFFLLLLPFLSQAQLSEKERFDISKNLDIYNSLFKELNLFYVDSIPVEKTIRSNINYILRALDPYTEYIPEEDMPSFLEGTTGEYAGVGAVISSRVDSNAIIVIDPYEGMPAQQAGLRAGDQLLEIDGVSMEGQNSSFASERLRGQPNTTVKIKYLRPGENKPKTISFERKRIEINPVIYYGVLSNKIGYIYLSSFTTHSAENIRRALSDLIENRQIESLIIDVRDNGGGVIEDCVEILNNFISKGELLLTMKGKVPQMDKTFRATKNADFPAMPIAVLVNQSSASAAEILAGTIQDMDRGVIIGTRTFGKGLVQSSRQLPYNGRLKLTTAKYYIPSGRCIQAIDYAHRREDGRVSYIPDSLTTTFYTKNGRPVKDGHGILPDLEVKEKATPNIAYYMDARNLFFDFVVDWRIKHPQIASPEDFILSDETYEAFKEYVKSQNFVYDRQSEKALENLKGIMEFENYMDSASEEFKALENKLKPDLDRDLDLYKDQLSYLLSLQIMKQYYYARGEHLFSLKGDVVVEKAIEVLSDTTQYDRILSK